MSTRHARKRSWPTCESQLNAARAEVTELAHGIHPAALTAGGLAPALAELTSRGALPVELRVDAGRFPAAVEAAAYFVCAEALTNVAKYARASRARIDAHREAGRLVLEIADDGVGGADPGRGSGLSGLRDRVEALGGQFRVESDPGSGTRVLARDPRGMTVRARRRSAAKAWRGSSRARPCP